MIHRGGSLSRGLGGPLFRPSRFPRCLYSPEESSKLSLRFPRRQARKTSIHFLRRKLARRRDIPDLLPRRDVAFPRYSHRGDASVASLAIRFECRPTHEGNCSFRHVGGAHKGKREMMIDRGVRCMRKEIPGYLKANLCHSLSTIISK